MIPKVIHFCWFGGKPLPESAEYCLSTWKKYCPDYEIRRWDESNFDVTCCRYVKEAYELKKWAFVSDYARFHILAEYGGIYLDTDVELLKPLDPLLACSAYAGIDQNACGITVSAGLGIAFEAGHPLLMEILSHYQSIPFVKNGIADTATTVCHHVTGILNKYGFIQEDTQQQVAGLTIYPSDYFSPKDFMSGKTQITPNTYSIHHYDCSWYTAEEIDAMKLRRKLSKWLPSKAAGRLSYFISLCRHRGFFKALKRSFNRAKEKL